MSMTFITNPLRVPTSPTEPEERYAEPARGSEHRPPPKKQTFVVPVPDTLPIQKSSKRGQVQLKSCLMNVYHVLLLHWPLLLNLWNQPITCHKEKDTLQDVSPTISLVSSHNHRCSLATLHQGLFHGCHHHSNITFSHPTCMDFSKHKTTELTGSTMDY
ncbi:hypothetical protein DPEC_G00111110 [Dallia pectoralis]|uniref:Uncharacterized protein n=1 Tax=Dallia pectoralis TaxID=75939 RepID=A0ACC2GT54_DALPE|nr:hypothetical protein DPEC_G00111110 [Dallia pectoralis]